MNKYVRLNRLKEYIRPDSYLLDIGTDHGILPVSVYEENITNKILATDISDKSLKKLRDKIKEKELNIETIVTDGLNNIELTNITDIVISGMGGILIKEILEKRIDELKDKRLILSHQSGLYDLRKFLIENGFSIIIEDMVYEDGKYYNILICEVLKEEKYSDFEYIFGKLSNQKSKDVYLDKLNFEKNIRENLLEKIGDSKKALNRKNE